MTLDYIFAKTTSKRAEIIATEQVVKEEEFQWVFFIFISFKGIVSPAKITFYAL